MPRQKRSSKGRSRISRARAHFRNAPPPLAPPPAQEPLPELIETPPSVVANLERVQDVELDPLQSVTCLWQDRYINRLLISSYFTHVLKSSPRSDWKGVGGTTSIIKDVFPHVSRFKINLIPRKTSHCKANGLVYMRAEGRNAVSRRTSDWIWYFTWETRMWPDWGRGG